MENKTYDGPERRQYFRYNIIFSPRQGAELTIGNHTFKVLDFSEGGLRFIKDVNFKIERRIRGTLITSDGNSREIDGQVVWDTGEEVGIEYSA